MVMEILRYIQSKQTYKYAIDEVKYFLIPLYNSCYLDCEYYKGSDFRENADSISMTIASWKKKAFLNELYNAETKKIANDYIKGKYLREEKSFLVAKAPIIVYKDTINRLENYEVELVEQGYIRFLQKDLIENLDFINSPLGVYDTLFRCSHKNIWHMDLESFVFLGLEIGWSKERIIDELYSPYMDYLVKKTWKNTVVKPVDILYLEACEVAYNKVKNFEFELPKKSLYDYECNYEDFIKGIMSGKIV